MNGSKRIGNPLTILAAALIVTPVVTFALMSIRLSKLFDELSLLPANERPSALRNGVEAASVFQNWGIGIYILGVVIMSWMARKGLRNDSRTLWKIAVSTGLLTFFQDHFFIGIISYIFLIIRKKEYYPKFDQNAKLENS